jgi:hypothetical protein
MNWNCSSSVQNNIPSLNSIAAKMAKKKKSGKLTKSEILQSSRGVTLAKMNPTHQNALFTT